MEKTRSLEQLALRLSHTADGADEQLNGLLVDIRKALKNGADARSLDQLSGRLAQSLLDTHGSDPTRAKADKGDESNDLSGLRKLIKSMPVPEAHQERMRALVTEIASDTSQKERQSALVKLLGAAAESLREVASSEKADGGVRRWLRRKDDSDNSGDHYVTLFVQLLRRLVDHIDVLNGNGRRSQAIKEALAKIISPDQAHELLLEVTTEIEAIDARIRAERSQTTDFLGTLRERLDGFEDVLDLLSVGSDDSLQRSEVLQDEVGQDTLALGEAAKTDDMDHLRGLIGQGMARITERLGEHVMAERTQHEASSARVTELTERLERLEEESDELRSEIRNKSDLALKDALTGVYNRAGFDERSLELYARWERSGADLSMVFTDCNRFKNINDTYGHAAGDLVLMRVADVLKTRARASDVVCRYGGDEFVILLPDTAVNGAEIFARAACEEVLDAGFNDNGKPLDVSISCGVTQLQKGDTLKSAVARADEAMYRAKKLDDINVCVAP